MAGEDLFASLYGARYQPIDTGWGIAAQGVSSALPGLVDPYGNPWSNFATVLGGALVSGLLGYQARQAADERNVLQSALITEALKPDITTDRQTEILAQDPRLSRVVSSLQLSRALAGIEAEKTRLAEEAKAKVDVQKQIDIERGVPYGTTKAGEVSAGVTPTVGGYTYLGKSGESELKDVQKTFSNRQEFKNYSYTTDVLKRLSQGVMKTDAVSDVDFAKGAIQAIEPGLATQQGEVNAITQSPSIPDQLKAAMANAAEGKGKLTPKIRAQIVGIVENAYTTQADKYNQQLDFFTKEAVTRTRRPELAEEIRTRVSDLGRAQPYEQVVQQWFKVPGVDLGDLDAAKVIRALANEQLQPEQLTEALKKRQAAIRPGETAQKASEGTGPSTVVATPSPVASALIGSGSTAAAPVVVASPTPGARLMTSIAPTAAPMAVSERPIVVTPVAPVKAPTADALTKANQKLEAVAELRALDKKGVANWTMEERVRALALKDIIRG